MPSTQPVANTSYSFSNFNSGANYIYLPSTLQQATGTGTSTWTIADNANGASQYVSALSLVNQGTIFVNGTNNFNAGSATTDWTVAGAAPGPGVGQQFFENDAAVNVIGTSGGGSTTANLGNASGINNLFITGSGQINIYGNAILDINLAVGVSSGRRSTSSAPTAIPMGRSSRRARSMSARESPDS